MLRRHGNQVNEISSDDVTSLSLEYEDTSLSFHKEDKWIYGEDGNVYLAKIDPLEQYDTVLKDMISHDDNLAYDKIKQIKFQGCEEYTIFCDEENDAASCASDIYFTERDEEIDITDIKTSLQNLSAENADSFVVEDSSDIEEIS